MTPGTGGGEAFFEGFLDDYFAEADDHLSAIRAALLALEGRTHKPGGDRVLLEDLFRRFHSLKGISGMVELREAELLAHQMESYLRLLREGEASASAHGLAVLFDATSALEQVVLARRRGETIPSIAQPMASLAALGVDSGTAPRTPAGSSGAAETAASDGDGGVRWRFTFVPSADRAAAGVNVNVIRARLAAAGEILHAAPDVHPDGAIVFKFLVSGAPDALAAAVAEHDGLSGGPAPAAEPDAPPVPPGTVGSIADETVGPVSPAHFIRVDLARLDDLMRIIGDLVISRARLEDTVSQAEPHMPQAHRRALQDNVVAVERQVRELRDAVMRVRLVKIGEIFRRMPFVVRDLGRDLDKRVRFEMRGQNTEIDKFLVERLMDPMLHLVRNAMSHGIEGPAERVAAGKPPDATLTLAASTVGEQVLIEVSDDGRGIDAAAVMRRARAEGLVRDDTAVDLVSLLCAPGFSTRDQTDRASGRGIGMSVVKTTIEELGGSIEVATALGAGTTFTLHVPLTLAITDALIATAGGETFAVPQAAVREVIEIDPAAVRSLENNEVVPYHGGVLPLMRLARVFGLEARPRATWHALVLGTGTGGVGLVVDRITEQREIVVRAITDPLIAVDGIAGATDLGDGRVVLILDAAALARHARTRTALGSRTALAS